MMESSWRDVGYLWRGAEVVNGMAAADVSSGRRMGRETLRGRDIVGKR